MSQPLDGTRQNDVLTYGLSLARAVTNRTEIVGELNGRASVATASRRQARRAADG